MSIVAEQLDVRAKRIAAVGFDHASQPKEILYHCPLCGADRDGYLNALEDYDRFGFEQQSDLCTRCGFVFLNPRLTRSAYGEFYEKWYRPLVAAYDPTFEDQALAETNRVAYTNAVCGFVGGYASHPQRKTALDVGGSYGHFAAELKSRWSYDATVLDPSPSELAIAESKGLKTIHALLEDWQAVGHYDLISLLQTVDHLLDPIGSLLKLRTCLNPTGIFLIDFVDFRTNYKNWGLQHSIKTDHPLYFTAYTAETLLARTGFEPIHSGRSSDHRHLIYVCRPMPLQIDFLPISESVEQAERELAEARA